MKAKYALPMVLAGSVMLSGCWLDDDDNDDNGSTDAVTQSILEIAVENENTTILEAAVLEADPSIAELLGGDDQLTVFAPTDAAFEALLGDLGKAYFAFIFRASSGGVDYQVKVVRTCTDSVPDQCRKQITVRREKRIYRFSHLSEQL